MKITPSNQTLILASERPGSSSQAGVSFDKVSGGAASSSVLQRVTIVAARPDAVVYLRADYAQGGDRAIGSSAASPTYARRATSSLPQEADEQSEAESSGTSLVPHYQSPSGAADRGDTLKDSFGNSASISNDPGLSSYLKPAEQYARTQRILSATPQAQYIDVHA